ncbi:MAG TPA: lamin tail domain-containing protein [Verrucomicrobiae bacterium]
MKHLLPALMLCAHLCVSAEILVPQNSAWRYHKGTVAPSSPVTAWRTSTFNDVSWLTGSAPFYYGETLAGGTVLSDMRNAYTTMYLRKPFSVSDASGIDRLALRVRIDDGYIAYINGQEVARFNVPAGTITHTNVAQSSIEMTWTTNSIANPAQYLVNGVNVLAVHVLNQARTSSDLVFDAELESTTDNSPPTIARLQPAPGLVSELTSLTVTFSEPVQGVAAADLLINNVPAQSVTGSGATYTYTFAQPNFGPVDITFDAGQSITDFANPPHPFDSANYRAEFRLEDNTAPFIDSVVPSPNTTVRQLSALEIKFSETVLGVDAADLLVDGVPATNVQARPGNTFVFQFPQQPAGAADISWAATHGIVDAATNSLVVQNWSYVVDPMLPIARVVISEFLASAENATGLKDEDGELQDWIELHNTSSSAVNLNGWSLTDDPEELDLWTFPNITLAAGGRLVVFASGKDRKPTSAGSRLHTSFKLGTGGEYLALFDSGSPRAAMTEFANDYPDQRNDYSYGTDSNGAWRYFQTPTPGQPNGTSSISGIVPKPDLSHNRGWYEAPFTLTITNELPGTTVRYTIDGSVPTETVGTIYNGPITVSSNLVLRAIGYRLNNLPSEVLTHTFLFPDHILRQPAAPAGYPLTWGTHSAFPNSIVPADYEMDPEIVSDATYGPLMKDALAALPVIAITIKTEDMFGAANGIYCFPLNRGVQWERPCSMEFITADGKDFQVDAGIQIQGNAAREPQKNPKHPLRVTFKGDYGPKSLDYKMFPDSPVSKFDTLILRADFNYSWLHWNPQQRQRAQRTRDSWVKDSMRAMGGLASHNRYVHLFINGLYWGVYDPSERPDGSFGEAYLGGDKEDYDVMNEGAAVDGTSAAYNAMLAITDVSTLPQYEQMKTYLDMPQFIDYMLLHFFIGHEDWFRNKNWYAIRPRDGSRGFLYVPWDGEMVLGEPTVNKVTATDLPSDLHPRLVLNAQYRMDFADRVHRHFFNSGALMPSENISRWMKRAREVELPIVAESARWGDYRRDVHQFQNAPYEFYERDVQFRAEQSRLVNTYFPGRTATVLNQLRNAGLYPSMAAPTFNQHGGKIDPGFQLSISGSGGTIYYSTNGVDPRVYGTGAVSPQARTYSASIALPGTIQVKARLYSAGNWSALTEATFTSESPRIPLRITELMYNPDPAGDAFEFIELQNFGPLPLDATGYYIEGVDYIFPPNSILAPGQIIVLGSADNPTRFAERYPGVTVYGRFAGQLLNRGERVALVAPNGRVAQSVDYADNNGWPQAADGAGPSLEIKNPFGDPDAPENWQSSAAAFGTPGQPNSTVALPTVVINEVYAGGATDWVEIHNTSGMAVDLSGWKLQDSTSTNILTFTSGTSVPATGYLVVECRSGSATPNVAPFGLDAEGETLILRNALDAIIDVVSFGPQTPENSIGRINERLELTTLTPSAFNSVAALGSPTSLVFNEWLADPEPGKPDWFEIYNTNPDLPFSLRGLFVALSNQVFEITSPVFVAAGGHVQMFADEAPRASSVDFKLPASGGTVQLLDPAGRVLTSVTYGLQEQGVTEGRYPDATDNIIRFPITPSPGAPNLLRFPISVSWSGANVVLQWSSVAGRVYRIEWSSDLTIWTTLREVTASGNTMVTGEPTSENSRYFRVIALP